MQTRWQSFVESCVQTVVAFWLSTLIQPFVLRTEGCHIGYEASMRVAIIFTIISFVRGYTIRRLFNWALHIWRKA